MKKSGAVAFVFLLGVVAFLLYLMSKPVSKPNIQPRTEKINTIKPSPSPTRVQSIPQINTASLPVAKAGQKYQANIFASLANSHQNLTAKVEGLPEGLLLGKCSLEYDVKFIPIPNTQLKCPVTGTPSKAGFYQLKVSVENEDVGNGFRTVEGIINFIVTSS